MKRAFLLSCLFVMALLLSGAAQRMQLGEIEIQRYDANVLDNSTSTRHGVGMRRYMQRVGGVAFDQPAQPVRGTVVKSLSLDYVPSANDGRRLHLTINGREVRVDLPDWQLIPIARFAATDSFSLVTLFGTLRDPKQEAEVKRQKGKVLNYHPKIENTLLGLRLFQLDMLILSPDAADLPSQHSSGAKEYILGRGESSPDVAKGRAAFREIQEYIRGVTLEENPSTPTPLMPEQKRIYRSYLICDCEQTVTFDVQGEALHITGHPVYYFWRSKADNPEYRRLERADELQKTVQQRIERARLSHQWVFFDRKAWYVQEIQRVLKSEAWQDVAQAFNIDVAKELNLPPDMPLQQAIRTLDTVELHRRLIKLEMRIEATEVEYLNKFSTSVSARQNQLRAINPAVWDAATNTMQFAAFFRYCRKQFRPQWDGFMAKINGVEPEPQVATPTVIYPPKRASLTR